MKKLNIFLLILNCFYISSCDDEKPELECHSGTVIYQISCNSENGLAFLIQVTEQNIIDTIATTTLPDIYQIEGSKIFFKTREPEHALFCTTNITPPKKEYDIYNLSNKPCSNE
jgi:hypothetical protein